MKIKVLPRAEAIYRQDLDYGFGPRQEGDAGIDLRAAEQNVVVKGATVAVPLGVAVELDRDTVGWITGRSSTVLSFGLLTHEGKIDSGYRGEIHALVTALLKDVVIDAGERIAQLVVLPIAPADSWRSTATMTDTARGVKGLGSTGRI
jgi:dUTP pyrophosphatase